MTNIICRRVGFSYPGAPFPVFTDLDLTIDAGWRGALIGRNGRGKTTLLRLIHGALLPESGRIEIATPTYLFPSATPPDQISVLRAVKDAVGPFVVLERRMAALLDEQTSEATREYSDLEAKYSRNHGYQIDAWIQRELDALEVPVAQYLAAKRGFLLVSHDRHFIDQAVHHVVSLNKADVTTMRGNYSSWRANFDADQQRELARNATLKKDIKRLTAAAGQRRAGARKREGTKGPHSDTGYIGHKAAKQMQRALNIERRSEREVRERRSLLKNHDKARALKLESAPASGPPLLTATNLGLDRGGRTLFDNVSFVVMPGERLAVCGGNGTGKTSLLEVLCGNLDGYRGTVKARSQLQTSRGYQDPLWTHGDLDAHLDRSGLDRSRFRQIMAVLGVAGEVLTDGV